MQFHVDIDNGTEVSGWVVPDNPSTVPQLRVAVDDREPVRISADIMRSDLKDLGLHRTGMVGFRVDESRCPGLSTGKDVSIAEIESGVLVFGRFNAERHAKLKLFYLELNAMPQTRLNGAIRRRFAMSHHAVERYPFDTLFSILNNQFSPSIYAAGRPFFKRYQQLLASRGFAVATMLRDPYEELAERLLFARYAVKSGCPPNVMEHLSGLEPLVELAERVDVSSEQSMRTAFSSLGVSQQQVLANPFVRALACDFEEPAERRHVGMALDNLATMSVVGLRQRFDTFKSILQELIGTDLLEQVQPVDVSYVPDVAAKLARIDQVKSLLALDLSLYALTRDAIGKAIAVA